LSISGRTASQIKRAAQARFCQPLRVPIYAIATGRNLGYGVGHSFAVLRDRFATH